MLAHEVAQRYARALFLSAKEQNLLEQAHHAVGVEPAVLEQVAVQPLDVRDGKHVARGGWTGP